MLITTKICRSLFRYWSK